LRLDYASAIRADTSKQDFTVAPRHWYLDATFTCDRCGEEYGFTAVEQRSWYEEYRFDVDSCPRECSACRRELRRLKSLRQEYDRDVARALASEELDLKVHVASVIDQLCEAGVALPAKVHANRALLSKQIARRGGRDDIGPNLKPR
jgi:hypothetical protein